MTKIVAFVALLYGSDYLEYAIRSVIDQVQEVHIAFDQFGHGSHGNYTDAQCPDTRNDLYSIAESAAGNKLHWHDGGPWAYEGLQRDSIYQYAPDADMVVTLDYDEIWQPGLLELALEQVKNSNIRSWRVSFRHYWRSFYRCILHDPAYPTRIVNTRASGGEGTIDSHGLSINHFGYSIRPEVMTYKWKVHGHKSQYRTDVDWFNDVYMANRQTDCHPVGSDAWNPEPVDPWQYLPDFMGQHEYASMDVIGEVKEAAH